MSQLHKNVIHSAKVASYFFSSEEFGISKDNVRISMSGVRDRKRKMVHGLIQMHLDNYKASGTELIMGTARFVAPKTLEVALPGWMNTGNPHGRQPDPRKINHLPCF